MLFLTRAAVCIGFVAVAASHAGGSDLASALDRGVRSAVLTAGQACVQSSDCLRVGAGLVAAATPPASDRIEDGPKTASDRAATAGMTVPLPPPRPAMD